MESKYFDNITDILKEIKERAYDRNYASFIGFEFNFNEKIHFRGLDSYDFFFQFLDNGQMYVTDKDFKEIIDELLLLKNINPTLMKKIIYRGALKEIEEKFKKNLITKEVYNNLINKYLS